MADASSSEDEEQATLVQRAVSTALVPVHVATSPSAIKAYLSTILFLTSSLILLTLSTTAYLFFYYNYIPQINLTRVIYLQYGAGPYPHATVPLPVSALVSQQPYDISIELHVPRTPNNLAAGNFMLELSLLGESTGSVPSKISSILPNTSSILPYTTIAASRRPAILPFSSPLLSLASTVLSLPWHMLSFRDLDAHHLSIPMFELLSFSRGSANLPCAIRLELQSDYVLQIYSAKIVFQVRFEGVRYLVYNYRVLSFLAFSGFFYTVTVSSMGVAWLLIKLVLLGSKTTATTTKKDPGGTRPRIKIEPGQESERAQLSNGRVKSEPSESGKGKANPAAPESESESSDHGLSLSNLSDSATTFPGIGRQMPLRMPVRKTTSSSATNTNPTIPTGRSGRVSLRGASPADAELAGQPSQAQVTTDDVADDGDDDDDDDNDGDEDEHRAQRQGGGLNRNRVGDAIAAAAAPGRDFDSGIGTSMESEPNPAAPIRRRSSSRQIFGEP